MMSKNRYETQKKKKKNSKKLLFILKINEFTIF